MAVRIPTNQIQNLQEMEAAVSGPDGANRLIIVSGQFDAGVFANAQPQTSSQQTQTFTTLVGPVFTRQQFFRAIATASLARTNFNVQAAPANVTWSIVNIDADWDDESGQVELRVEVTVQVFGNASVSVNNIAFQVTILGIVTAQ